MPVRVVVPPVEEPVSLARAKAHLRIPVSDDAEDELILGLITAAREQVESLTGLALARATLEMTDGGFPDRCGLIELPSVPLVHVEAVAYTDATGVEQVLAPSAYVVEPRYGRALRLASGTQAWPTARSADGIAVRYVAGYEPTTVPQRAVQAMLLLIGHWYFNREAVITGTISTELPQTVQVLTRGLDVRSKAH